MPKKPFLRRGASKRGQSFAELMLVTIFLMILLAGVVEFGFLLNNYLHIFDAAREAARFGSSQPTIDPDTGFTNTLVFDRIAAQALRVMLPVVLRGNHASAGGNHDDIVISVLSVQGTLVNRYPSSSGWSMCTNHGDPEILANLPAEILPSTFLDDWEVCSPRTSSLSDAEIAALLDPLGPPTGILLVEIFYNEDQVLNLPLVSDLLPNPIPIYVYSVMPNAPAEPTLVGP